MVPNRFLASPHFGISETVMLPPCNSRKLILESWCLNKPHKNITMPHVGNYGSKLNRPISYNFSRKIRISFNYNLLTSFNAVQFYSKQSLILSV